jgi:RNA polymerase sigma-70 factor (ECF subfamily)
LFEEVLRQEGAALRRVAASYERDRGLQEDLFQDICLALWRALATFREESSLRTFAFRIAHNRATTHALRRSRLRETELEDEAEAARLESVNGECRLEAQQRAQRLHDAVGRLPLSMRQVLTLTLEGLSQREVGEVLGLTEGNVAVRVSRARAALRRLLGEAGDGDQ